MDDRFDRQARLRSGAVGPPVDRPHRHDREPPRRPPLRGLQSAHPVAMMTTSTEITPPSAAATPLGDLREFWHYFSVNRGAVVGLVVFLLLVLVALFAPWIAPHSPDVQYRDALLLPPSWDPAG